MPVCYKEQVVNVGAETLNRSKTKSDLKTRMHGGRILLVVAGVGVQEQKCANVIADVQTEMTNEVAVTMDAGVCSCLCS